MNVCMCPARTVWFSFYLGCHRSAVSLSTLNVFPLTHTIAPKWVSDPSGWGSVPPPTRAGLVLLTLLFFPLVPLFYQVFCNSIYSFPLVRTSCPLSDGVLHALLCLKVYPSFIREERCTVHLPTPPPSCSSIWSFCLINTGLKYFYFHYIKWNKSANSIGDI